MKNIPTFDSFVNESIINEATAVDKVQPIAREFIKAVETEFKKDIEESQIVKMAPKGFEIRVVIANDSKMFDWAIDYTNKHKDDLKGIPLQFKLSPAVTGRKTLWPSNNKMYFDIVEESK